MMVSKGLKHKKGSFLVRSVRQLALIGAVTLSSAFSVACAADAPASSERMSADQFIEESTKPASPAQKSEDLPAEPLSREFKLETYQNPDYDSDYSVAWKVLEPIYNGTQYDKKAEFKTNPFIGIGTADLNGDDEPEIIAEPMETDSEINLFCKHNTVCPFYILEKRENGTHTLGVIWAETLDLGDQVKNGYWTLKAHTKKNPGDKPYGSYFEIYQYDKKKDGYVKASTSDNKP